MEMSWVFIIYVKLSYEYSLNSYAGPLSFHVNIFLAPSFFGWCRTGGGGGVFSTPLHNSFVFKVKVLEFCKELLWDRMKILR